MTSSETIRDRRSGKGRSLALSYRPANGRNRVPRRHSVQRSSRACACNGGREKRGAALPVLASRGPGDHHIDFSAPHFEQTSLSPGSASSASGVTSALVQAVPQLLTALEERDLLFGDRDAVAGPRIATNPRVATFDRKGTETP